MKIWKDWGKTLGEDDFIDANGDVSYTYPAPIDGEIEPLSAVADENFASGKMGQGFAIKPTIFRIRMFSGTVKVTFPTRHAIAGIDQGIATLIHIGIGTVNMRGTGFIQYVEQDQKVEKGDLLIEFGNRRLKRRVMMTR